MSKLKTLWVSAAAYNSTGYGLQTYQIVKYLQKNGYDITVRGTDIRGAEFTWDEIPHVPNQAIYTHMDNSFTEQVERLGITNIISLFDNWVWTPDLVRTIVSKGIPWIQYIPIDTEGVSPAVLATAREASLIITMSKYGLEQLQKVRGMPPSIHIPHSIDTNTFKSYPRTINKDKFVAIQVKQNSEDRPNWPELFETWKWFIHKTGLTPQETILYCHTNPTPAPKPEGPTGYNLPLLAEIYGIREYVAFPKDLGYTMTLTREEQAKKLFSQADVLACPVSEGFGLPILEAGACEVPSLVIGQHGGQCELVPEYCRVKVGCMHMRPTMARKAHWDTEAAADKLVELYENESLRKDLGKQSREIALNYDNEKILPMWLPIMEKTEELINSRRLLKWAGTAPIGVR